MYPSLFGCVIDPGAWYRLRHDPLRFHDRHHVNVCEWQIWHSNAFLGTTEDLDRPRGRTQQIVCLSTVDARFYRNSCLVDPAGSDVVQATLVVKLLKCIEEQRPVLHIEIVGP